MTGFSREPVTRITIHATIESAENSSAPQLVQIGEVTRDARVAFAEPTLTRSIIFNAT